MVLEIFFHENFTHLSKLFLLVLLIDDKQATKGDHFFIVLRSQFFVFGKPLSVFGYSAVRELVDGVSDVLREGETFLSRHEFSGLDVGF